MAVKMDSEKFEENLSGEEKHQRKNISPKRRKKVKQYVSVVLAVVA